MTTELTLGFAEVQGMVRYGDSERLSRVDVSPRIVVALGVSFLGGGGRIEEEEKRGDPEHTEKPLFLVRVEGGLHWTVSRRARKVTGWQQRVAARLQRNSKVGVFLPPSLLLRGKFCAGG